MGYVSSHRDNLVMMGMLRASAEVAGDLCD